MTVTAPVLPGVHRGLVGVVADDTAVSTVDAETDELLYRGHPVTELAAYCSIEQVVQLLWTGELPDAAADRAFRRSECAGRHLDAGLVAVLDQLPADAHPMAVLRTAISVLGARDDGGGAVALLAALPTVAGRVARRRRGLAPVAPRDDLGLAAHVLWMCRGREPTAVETRALEQALVLYAEHGFSASTFAARVVASTGADLSGALTAAVAALAGGLHGGATEAVMRLLIEVDDPDGARRAVDALLDRGDRLPGFGQRAYRGRDVRVRPMEAVLDTLVDRAGPEAVRLREVHRAVAERALQRAGLFPNLDFPAAPVYRLLGFEPAMSTPLFVLARVAGWAAHVAGQTAHNRLIHPAARYVGPARRAVPCPAVPLTGPVGADIRALSARGRGSVR